MHEFRRWFDSWKAEISEHKYLIILSLIFLALAEIICYRASIYVDKFNGAAVQDIILDNIPTVNMQFFFVYGFMLVLAVATIYTLIFQMKKFHEVAFIFCLLVLVRSFFITLTHLGMPSDAMIITGAPTIFQSMTFRNDLFFSGHVAMSFLAFLIFRKEFIGKFFFAMTLIMVTTVLLMHVHYSIDVFSAFFITYGVYTFGEWVIGRKFWDKISGLKSQSQP